MSRVDADRNLLLGILAAQMDFISRDALFAAMNAWIVRKQTPLGALLVERGELAQARRELLEALVDEHVRAHGGDAARSLHAMSSVGPVAEDLGRLSDRDIQASVAHLRKSATGSFSDDPDATRSHTAMGAPTSWNGRFRVVRPHARGGLGVVSVALDDELDREVAFKEIKDEHADDRGRQAQFVLEAEITGKLEHPGIIPIYGLGHDPVGRPFYAMRFIRGDSLADAINRFHDPGGPFVDPVKRSLQLRELLGRFLDVCDAVAYAHSRGVLHRDLKPGNIMLGPFGETLVVDWGLALPLERVPDGHESPQGAVKPTKADSASLPREQGTVLGTPAFMPPEQAEGAIDKLGPRSDVYGLGAILYDLLTGKKPVEGTSVVEVVHRVGRGEIKAPRLVRPEVPAALEAVCLKALALRPEDRYSSSRALAADIKAWLADEPVSARPEPFAERARRWAKRNRTTVTAASAALLVGLIGLGSVAVVQTRARDRLDRANSELKITNAALAEQRSRAEDRETQAIEAVKKFRDAVANEPELKNSPGLEGLRKRLLKEPLAFFRALRDRLQADHDTRPESLHRLAQASFDLGVLTNEIGDRQDALIAFEEAMAIRHKLADANPNVTEVQRDLAASHFSIGFLLKETGKPAEALSSYESALAIGQKLADANPTVTELQSGLAYIHSGIGVLLSETGKPAEALKSYESALAIQQKLADANPTVAEFQSNLAYTHNTIGNLLSDIGKTAEALNSYESALAISQKLADANPTISGFQSLLAIGHNNIGILLGATGKPAEALNALKSALAIQQKLADFNPTITEFQLGLADSHINIGNLLSKTGKPAEALKAYESALTISQKLADFNPTVTAFQSSLASGFNNIGSLLMDTGKPAEALKAGSSALAVRQNLADANPTVTKFQTHLALSHNEIGRLLSDTGKPAEALKSYESALAIQQKLADANPTVTEFQSHLAASHYNIGLLLSGTGKLAEAIRCCESALAIQQKLADANPTVTEFQNHLAASHNNIGNLLRATSKPAEALKSYESALAIQQKLADANPTVTEFQSHLAASHYNIGLLLSDTGKQADALKAYESALPIRRRLAQDHPESPDFASELGASLNNLAMIDLNAKRFDIARKRLQEAIASQRRALATNPAHPTYRQFLASHLTNLIVASRGLGDSEGVAEAERELAELRDSDPAVVAFDKRLSAIIQGDDQPKDNRERLQLAQRAYDKALHATGAKLWADAFVAEPKLAEDRQAQHPYAAACAAALAGCGQGKDEKPPDDAAKAKLRDQAHAWLQAELAAWTKLVESGPAAARPLVAQTLKHWHEDTDLAGVRDAKALDVLSESERKAWRALWSDVDALLAKAQNAPGPAAQR